MFVRLSSREHQAKHPFLTYNNLVDRAYSLLKLSNLQVPITISSFNPSFVNIPIQQAKMHFTTSAITFFAVFATLSTTHPTPVEKRLDCGPASQYYQPGANCENTLYTSGGGHGGYGCGPASQYYKPGPNCENTLYTTGGGSPTNSTGGAGGALACGPASQYYKPGPQCENTLYTNGGSGTGTTSTPPATTIKPSSSSDGSSPVCAPASQYYKPGPNCENTLYTS